jgi:hypothetical protein
MSQGSLLEIFKNTIDKIKLYYVKIFEAIDQMLFNAIRDVDSKKYEHINDIKKNEHFVEINWIESAIEDVGKLFEICDNVYYIKDSLDEIVNTITSEDVLNRVRISMSRSYFEDMDRMIYTIRSIEVTIEKLFGEISRAAASIYSSTSLDLNDLKMKYIVTDRSSLSTKILMGIIENFDKSDPDIRELLEIVKNKIFNINETKDTILTDIKSREVAHPIQSMGLTFDLIESSEEIKDVSDDNNIIVNKTFPLTGKYITYDLDALSKGTGETFIYGLNHKIIERLDTIREKDLPIIDTNAENKSAKSSLLSGIPKVIMPDKTVNGLFTTINHGLTYNKMINTNGDEEINGDDFKYICAGPKPRIDVINGCISEYIMENIDTNIDERMTKYEKSMEEINYPFVSNLANFLYKEFQTITELEKKDSNINPDKAYYRAATAVLKDYLKSSLNILELSKDHDKESKIWVMTTSHSLGLNIMKYVKKLHNKSRDNITTALLPLEENIPPIPFKLFKQ